MSPPVVGLLAWPSGLARFTVIQVNMDLQSSIILLVLHLSLPPCVHTSCSEAQRVERESLPSKSQPVRLASSIEP